MQIILSSHTILIILYSNKHFFRKNPFFQHFFIPDMSFFLSIFIQHSRNIFSKALVFFCLLFKIKQHPTEWETIFLYIFSSKIKTHFFVLTKVKFLNFNYVRKFITTKIGKYFFNFFLENHNTRVFALLTCKRNIRTEVSLHVS